MRYNLKNPSEKPTLIPYKLPANHFIEAIQSYHKGILNVMVCAVRISDERVYFGYIDLESGRLLNSTMQYKQLTPVTNSQISFVSDRDILTVCFVANQQLYTWQLNEISQTQIVSQQPMSLTSGAFLNKICLFVGSQDRIQVLSAENGFVQICQLKVAGSPRQMVYHAVLQQLLVCTTDSMLHFFELGLKNCQEFVLEGELLSYPVYSTRFPITAIVATHFGYLCGDSQGRAFGFKICRNELQQQQVSLLQKGDINKSVQETKHNKGLFVVQNEDVKKVDIKEDKEVQKQCEQLLNYFPFTSKVQGYGELLANPIVVIQTFNTQDQFLCATANTFCSYYISMLTQQDDEVTQSLGFSKKLFQSFLNSKRYFNSLSLQQLQAESRQIQEQTALQRQLALLDEHFYEITCDTYQLLQAYFLVAFDGRFLGDSEMGKTKEDFYTKPEDLQRWMPLFEQGTTRQADFQIFYDHIRSELHDDPSQDQVQGLTVQTLQILPFIPGLVRNIKKRYQKGYKELAAIQQNLQPQLDCFEKQSATFLGQTAEQIFEIKAKTLQNIVDALKKEIYQNILEKLEGDQIAVGRCKELMRGTAHKYMLDDAEIQKWTQNRAQFLQLRAGLVKKLKQLHSGFSGTREVYQETLQQYGQQALSSIQQIFAKKSDPKMQLVAPGNHFFIAGNRVNQCVVSLAEMQDQFKNPLEQKAVKPLYPGICYDAYEMVKNEQKVVVKLSSKQAGEKMDALEELEEEVFNYSYLKFIQAVEQPAAEGVDYFLVFERPENCVSLQTVFKFLLQKLQIGSFFAPKQMEQLEPQLAPMLSQNPLKTVSMLSYNMMLLMKHEKDLPVVPFCLSNYFVNPLTLQVVGSPIAHLPAGMLKTESMLEFNISFQAPEQILQLSKPKSDSYSVGLVNILLLSLLKASQLAITETTTSQAIVSTIKLIMANSQNQVAAMQEIQQRNLQIMKQQGSKFNPMENDMGYSHGFVRNLICVFRGCANLSQDVSGSLSPEQTQQILQDFLESKNVQLANFVLQQAIIKPYMADDMKAAFDDRLFNQNLLQQLLVSLKMGDKAKANYTEFLDQTVCLFQKQRLEPGKLLKLKYFKPCNDLVEDYQDLGEDQLRAKNAEKNRKQRETEMKFRLRPWRGKHGVEYGSSKVQKEAAEKVPETLSELPEEIEESDEEEIAWIHEQHREKERFRRDQERLHVVVEFEQQQSEKKKKNQKGESQFDWDEGDQREASEGIEAAFDDLLQQAEKVRHLKEKGKKKSKKAKQMQEELPEDPQQETEPKDPEDKEEDKQENQQNELYGNYDQFYDPFASTVQEDPNQVVQVQPEVQTEMQQEFQDYDPYAAFESNVVQEQQEVYDPYAQQTYDPYAQYQ